jgi:hypothetical protein
MFFGGFHAGNPDVIYAAAYERRLALKQEKESQITGLWTLKRNLMRI